MRTLSGSVWPIRGRSSKCCTRRSARPDRAFSGLEPLEPRVLLSGTISGVKFEDLNASGVRDAGEPGIAGVTIFLDTNGNGVLDGDEADTLTSETGAYAFTDLVAGTYRVAEVLAGGFQRSSPEFTVLLSGANEVPSNNSPGIGYGFFVLDEATRTFAYRIDFSGLSGTPTMMHIHEGTPTQNGPVR